MKSNVELFTEEKVYDEQISPLMMQIVDICNENNIPMICGFAYENCEEKGLGFCTTYINNKENRFIDKLAECKSVIMRSDNFTMAMTITKGE